jgi:alpha-L-arabinofuranosidase
MDFDPKVKLVEKDGRFVLQFSPGAELKKAPTTLVTTDLLGTARIPGLPYLDADGAPLKVNTDFFGKTRGSKPTPGPFEKISDGAVVVSSRSER